LIGHRLKYIWDNSEGKILDIGCERGELWKIFGSKDVTGIDCDNWNPEHIKFIQGFAEDLPFRNNEFDTVILGDILEHVKDIDIVIKEAFRVCKNKLIITVPDEYHYNGIKPFWGKKEALNPKIDPGGYQQYLLSKQKESHLIDDDEFPHLWHVRHFNKSSFVQMIRKVSKKYKIESHSGGGWAFYYAIVNKE